MSELQEENMSHQVLNCCGMSCPMPIVAISKLVKTMKSEEKLEILASDLAFKLDLEAWARRTGHKIESFEDGETQRAIIQIR